jgi:hypothetical protein
VGELVAFGFAVVGSVVVGADVAVVVSSVPVDNGFALSSPMRVSANTPTPITASASRPMSSFLPRVDAIWLTMKPSDWSQRA